MDLTDVRLRGIKAIVREAPPNQQKQKRYRVRFESSRIDQVPVPDQVHGRAPYEAAVIIECDPEPHVVRYDPPEFHVPGVERQQWEELALQAVREHLGLS